MAVRFSLASQGLVSTRAPPVIVTVDPFPPRCSAWREPFRPRSARSARPTYAALRGLRGMRGDWRNTGADEAPFFSRCRERCLIPGNGGNCVTVARRTGKWRRQAALANSEVSYKADESEPEIAEEADCVVVGAGISGLSAAFALATRHADAVPRVLVTEARERVGGNVTTMVGAEGTESEGYVWEEGPHSFQPSDTMLQCALNCGILPDLVLGAPDALNLDCGILSDLVLGAPDAPRYVFWDGKLRPIPSGPADLISSDLLSLGGKLRAALGFVGIRAAQVRTGPAQRGGSEEESVSEFVTRNLGSQLLQRLVDPFCSCIFAGDAEQMSMQAAFNRIWRMEGEGGSLLGGMIQLGKERKEKEKENPAEPRDPRLPEPQGQSVGSFRSGLASLTRAMADRLGSRMRVGWRLVGMQQRPGGGAVLTYDTPRGTTRVAARSVLLTVPAYVAADVIRAFSLHSRPPRFYFRTLPHFQSSKVLRCAITHNSSSAGNHTPMASVALSFPAASVREGGGGVGRGASHSSSSAVRSAIPYLPMASPSAAAALAAIPYPPMASVALSYPAAAIREGAGQAGGLRGYGQLHPRSQGLATLGETGGSGVRGMGGAGRARGLKGYGQLHPRSQGLATLAAPTLSRGEVGERWRRLGDGESVLGEVVGESGSEWVRGNGDESGAGGYGQLHPRSQRLSDAPLSTAHASHSPASLHHCPSSPLFPTQAASSVLPSSPTGHLTAECCSSATWGSCPPLFPPSPIPHPGCIYSSALFPNRAPDGRVLLICYVGGAGNDAVAEMTHTDLIAAVDRDMRTTLLRPSAPPPLALGVRVWPCAVPQLNIGHLESIEVAKRGIEEAGMEGVFLGGNYLTGVALSCLSQVSLSGEAKSSHVAQRHVASRRGARCDAATAGSDGKPRVRFAPSPTGNLHVGGARTALFNWLFARATGGKFVLRVEDTDLNRSTPESEAAMVRDLRWLGLDWDEGPDVGGPLGPYRQSERNEIYRELTEKLLASGMVYRCFCSDEELAAMKAEQEAKKLPPKYAGKWARASEDEVAAELAKGTPHSFRFRVPPNKLIKINDLVRGEVAWNTDTLGDFVVLRSNGQPVYNFCVTVDDATMKISHVIRAEEHLPNTLRQALIYEALGLPMPTFGHVSLILAPDRSKLSKRHGATSVGQFKELGFLPEAMVNYLALLGWNDGTEDEIFTPSQLVEKFSLSRVTKSAAIFDNAKLRWINGQHFRQLSEEASTQLLAEQWHASGLLASADATSRTTQAAASLVRNGLELVTDADAALEALLAFPLKETLASEEAKAVVEDGLDDVRAALLAEWESGALLAAVDGGAATWKKWIKGFGKATGRKGKRLFMPIRVLLTGCMHGPDVGETLTMLQHAAADKALGPKAYCVGLEERISLLRDADLTAAPAAAEAVAASVAQ
ncbi:unnamed protein product [Closterium sp. Naga37s-1]|nr:unnamed protein product [Closterium sp. Naga37s-1]